MRTVSFGLLIACLAVCGLQRDLEPLVGDDQAALVQSLIQQLQSIQHQFVALLGG